LGFLDDARKEVEESFEIRERLDPLGVFPGRCDVTYGPAALDVLRGKGE
jgi:hypothetical protein